MPPQKELRFFSEKIGESPGRHLLIDDNYRQKRRIAGMPNSLIEYSELFKEGKFHKALGEASPEYVHSERAARQIHRVIPAVRLIVSLRRPSDRAYSLYQMAHRSMSSLDFASAFRMGKNEPWVRSIFSHDQMRLYYDLFDSSQIKPIKFDDLAVSTDRALKGLFEFLGVASDFQIPQIEIHNEGGYWRSSTVGSLFRAFRANWAVSNFAKQVLPKSVWKMAKKVEKKNRRPAPRLDEELRYEVDEYYRGDTLKLQDLVGLDLSSWLQEKDPGAESHSPPSE